MRKGRQIAEGTENMNRKLLSAAVVVIFFAGLVTAYRAGAQQPQPANIMSESPSVEYAKAYWELARLNYDRLRNANADMKSSELQTKLKPVARAATFAEACYKAAVAQQQGGNGGAIFAEYADALAAKAEKDCQAATDALNRRVGSKSAVEAKRFVIEAQLAKARAAKAKAAIGAGAFDATSWKVDFLSEELVRGAPEAGEAMAP